MATFFFFFFFFESGLKLDEKSIENGLEGQKFLVVCLFWGGCHHPNKRFKISIKDWNTSDRQPMVLLDPEGLSSLFTSRVLILALGEGSSDLQPIVELGTEGPLDFSPVGFFLQDQKGGLAIWGMVPVICNPLWSLARMGPRNRLLTGSGETSGDLGEESQSTSMFSSDLTCRSSTLAVST